MKLLENKLYHYYNQGNNKERIFYSRKNQIFFMDKFRRYVSPHCEVLAYCLMPNHFHFLISTTNASVVEKKVGSLGISALNNGFRLLLSTYTQAINKQEGRTGSLFRQKTKAKMLEDQDKYYPQVCFQYIHQNPLAARLVDRMEDWEFSSFQDFLEVRKGTICNTSLAYELLGISKENFYPESYQVLSPEKVKRLYQGLGG